MADWPYNTKAWRKLRLAKLAAEPLCYACKLRGLNVPARAVDHIHAIAKGGDPFPPFDRLMSLCFPCHNSKTRTEDHPQSSGFSRAIKGFDAQGNPIDYQMKFAAGKTCRKSTAVTNICLRSI